AREGVGRFALLVEGEPGEVLRVLLVTPMLKDRFSAVHGFSSFMLPPPTWRRQDHRRCRSRPCLVLHFSFSGVSACAGRSLLPKRRQDALVPRHRRQHSISLGQDLREKNQGRVAPCSTPRPSTRRGNREPARRKLH